MCRGGPTWSMESRNDVVGKVMHVFFDYVAFDSPRLRGPLTFRGTNPRIESDLLHVGPIDVCDADGNVLLLVERGVCRKYGEVEGAF